MSSVFNYRCRLPAEQVRKWKKEPFDSAQDEERQNTEYRIQYTEYRRKIR